ncbi:hypothetical protein D3C87_1244450 [compost metagenome]
MAGLPVAVRVPGLRVRPGVVAEPSKALSIRETLILARVGRSSSETATSIWSVAVALLMSMVSASSA